MQHDNSTITEYRDNDTFSQALDRGERFLFKGFVHGFGVKLPSRQMLHVPDEPVTREEAETLRAALSVKYPDATVVRMGVHSESVAETQKRSPGDQYFIHLILELEPGVVSKQTNLDFATFEEATRIAEAMKAAGCLAAQLEKVPAKLRAA